MSRGPRIAYLDGDLELTSPSKDQERIKSHIGRLVEAFALERDIDLSPYGSWTLKDAPKRAGVEPDECYLVGSNQSRSTPDLVMAPSSAPAYWTETSSNSVYVGSPGLSSSWLRSVSV